MDAYGNGSVPYASVRPVHEHQAAANLCGDLRSQHEHWRLDGHRGRELQGGLLPGQLVDRQPEPLAVGQHRRDVVEVDAGNREVRDAADAFSAM
jgi:hypothetical protein